MRVWIAAVMLCCSGLAFASPQPQPPQVAQQVIPAQQQQPSPQQQPTKPDARGTEEAPFVITIPKGQVETDADQKQATERSNTDWWTVFIAKMTLGILVIQAGVFAWQGQQLKRTVATMRDTAQRQLRAYVFIDSCSLVAANADGQVYEPLGAVRAATRPALILHYKNTGQTPAYQVVTQSDMRLVPWPLNPSDLPPVAFEKGGTTDSMGPGAVRRKYDIPDERVPMLTDADITALKEGTKAIFVYGEIRYMDTFGKPQFTRYRSFVGGPTALRGTELSGHDEGNEAT